MNEKYAALIFDVIDSRKILDRYEAQIKLREMTKFLNVLYKDKIVKDVTSGSGDEFQGLFKTIEDAYAYIHSLQLYIYPIRVRCGIGYGSIKYITNEWVTNDEWKSTDIDGEAYYRARDAINAIPNKNSIDLVFFKTNNEIDKTLNTIMLSSVYFKKNQSKTAKLIELIMDFYFPFTETNLDNNHLESFSEILKYKLKDNLEESLTKSFSANLKIGKEYSLDDIDKIDLKIIVTNIHNEIENIKNKEKDKDLYFNEYYPHGCSTLIAPLTLSTPQNVNKTVSLGKIKENRNLDGAIFDILKNIDNIGGE